MSLLLLHQAAYRRQVRQFRNRAGQWALLAQVALAVALGLHLIMSIPWGEPVIKAFFFLWGFLLGVSVGYATMAMGQAVSLLFLNRAIQRFQDSVNP